MNSKERIVSYEDMSNFEINNYAAFSLKYLVQTEFSSGMLGFTREYHEQYPDNIWAAYTDDRGEQSEAWEQMNFCAMPELTMPVVFENKIGLHPNEDGSYKAYSMAGGFYAYEVNDDNPLRAAMIVFLMMKEAEQ